MDSEPRQRRAANETFANSEVDPSSLVVYTAFTGHYDSLTLQPEAATRGADLVAFVDGETPDPKTIWRCRRIDPAFDDPVLNAKIYKILPHRFFPDKAHSLWMDGNVVINFSFQVERLLSDYLADHDLAAFRHSRRTCLYQEAQAILHQRLDAPRVVRRQIERYTREVTRPMPAFRKTPFSYAATRQRCRISTKPGGKRFGGDRVATNSVSITWPGSAG